ncbi:hypothetical protein FRX31_024742, partial [Thalictrum thalictroides]
AMVIASQLTLLYRCTKAFTDLKANPKYFSELYSLLKILIDVSMGFCLKQTSILYSQSLHLQNSASPPPLVTAGQSTSLSCNI